MLTKESSLGTGLEILFEVKGIFSVSSNPYPLIPKVLLVDDVWITGSTLKSAANVLKRAGMKKV